MTTFGDLLYDARRQAGMTQRELALRAGIDQSYLARLEAGQRAPSRMTIHALALALSLTGDDVVDLFGSAGYVPFRRSELVTR